MYLLILLPLQLFKQCPGYILFTLFYSKPDRMQTRVRSFTAASQRGCVFCVAYILSVRRGADSLIQPLCTFPLGTNHHARLTKHLCHAVFFFLFFSFRRHVYLKWLKEHHHA